MSSGANSARWGKMAFLVETPRLGGSRSPNGPLCCFQVGQINHVVQRVPKNDFKNADWTTLHGLNPQ